MVANSTVHFRGESCIKNEHIHVSAMYELKVIDSSQLDLALLEYNLTPGV